MPHSFELPFTCSKIHFLSLLSQSQFSFCWFLLPVFTYPLFPACSLHLFAQFSSHSSLPLVPFLFPYFFCPSFLSNPFHPLPVVPCLFLAQQFTSSFIAPSPVSTLTYSSTAAGSLSPTSSHMPSQTFLFQLLPSLLPLSDKTLVSSESG